MKNYTETPCPSQSPWGSIQTRKRIAAGLWSVSTARHGGLYMSPDRCADFQKLFPRFEGYADLPWLEEDLDYCAGIIAFPAEFDLESVFYAVEKVTTYKSSLDGVFYFGQVRDWLLSNAGAGLRTTAQLFGEDHKHLWRRCGCSGGATGWITYWTRGNERRQTTSCDYITDNWKEDNWIEKHRRTDCPNNLHRLEPILSDV